MHYLWTCRCCGRQFDTLPLDFGCVAPDPWLQIPESERAERGKLNSDLCTIDNKHNFVRWCLEVPIIGHDDCFVWGVWVSVSDASFARILELWDAPIIENEPPKFGWLCNNISLYPSTLNLKCQVHLRAGSDRPSIELEPTNHPLAIEQRQGISLSRIEEIAAALSARH
jgi:hypothetical protein